MGIYYFFISNLLKFILRFALETKRPLAMELWQLTNGLINVFQHLNATVIVILAQNLMLM